MCQVYVLNYLRICSASALHRYSVYRSDSQAKLEIN